jgi:transglutaminase/protease-like cytokinesis protein 3
MVHDYLVDNIEYDSTISKSNIYNIYGALINKECVCEGYAKSMKYLLDALDIESVLIVGTATNSENKTEDHAWNYVNIDDKWYAIDTTWDDPIIIGGGKLTNELKYKYFLKGSTEFNKNHIENGQFTDNGKVFIYPSLSSKDY